MRVVLSSLWVNVKLHLCVVGPLELQEILAGQQLETERPDGQKEEASQNVQGLQSSPEETMSWERVTLVLS